MHSTHNIRYQEDSLYFLSKSTLTAAPSLHRSAKNARVYGIVYTSRHCSSLHHHKRPLQGRIPLTGPPFNAPITLNTTFFFVGLAVSIDTEEHSFCPIRHISIGTARTQLLIPTPILLLLLIHSFITVGRLAKHSKLPKQYCVGGVNQTNPNKTRCLGKKARVFENVGFVSKPNSPKPKVTP